MPMYEYQCGECGTVNEYLFGVGSDEPEIACSSCGSESMRRLISLVSVSRGAQPEGCACERGGEGHGACGGAGACACGM